MRRKLFFLLFAFTALALRAFSQQSIYNGSWTGTLELGVELRIVFHITSSPNGTFSATADSPDQQAYGLKCDTVFISNDSVHIHMQQLQAYFAGKAINDSVINGTFNQRIEVPLILTRTNQQRRPALNRPQTPLPPFPYRVEEVEYDNKDRSLHYGGTLTIPNGEGPFPSALLITGSGQQNRDEEIMGHKTFAVLADALTRNGFIVLRVDDRGIGKSTGIFKEATTADFAKDASTSFDYLLSRAEVNKKKSGLIGHSEGGMVAPIVATDRSDIDFIVLLAGPGIKITDLMAEQNAAILRSAGISNSSVTAYSSLYKEVLQTIVTQKDPEQLKNGISSIVSRWAQSTDTVFSKELGLNTSIEQQKLTSNLIEAHGGKWFSYFLSFDPQPYLQKLNCKVLALNGSRDIQVLPTSNLAGIQASLKKSKARNKTIKELPGLNHLFQTCKQCTIGEYGTLEETFSPIAITEINNWLNTNVK